MVKLANSVVINTGLTDSASLNVLKSTLGQLSDGMWENSRKAERYWPFAEAEMVDGKVCLVISKEYSRRGYTNGFVYDLGLDPVRIKNYFSRKVAEVVRQEAKDNPDSGIRCAASCEVALDYMSDYDNYENKIRACDAHRVYKALKAA